MPKKQELTGKHYSINDRLRLFHGTVMPTMLYGCEAWTLTTELEHRIQKTQRQMLRMIVKIPRRNVLIQSDTEGSDVTSNPHSDQATHGSEPEPTLEPWVDWIRRSTHEAEEKMKKLKMEDWVTLQRRRKWRWAHKIATTTTDSWNVLALTWDPGHRQRTNLFSRRVGRPKVRWADDIKHFIYRKVYNTTPHISLNARLDHVTWIHHAQDAVLWRQLESEFVNRPNIDEVDNV
jgi:hypothetical protein